MHFAVLMFYRNDLEKPLPSLDEILIVTPETPREQVELIVRRAFADRSGKIFVVMNADNMDFDCGVHIEGLFRTHMEVVNKDYRLIFVVSKESQRGARSSYISTAFDKYHVTIPNLEASADECGRYLLRHLSVGKGASRHDPDRSRFRLVCSSQSGNGKSLLCHRIKQGGCRFKCKNNRLKSS